MEKIQQLLNVLEAKNFSAHFAHSSIEAKDLVLSLIPKGSTVGIGNTLSLREIGLFQELLSGNYNFINQFESEISSEENLNRRRHSLLSDVYITGTNAITMNGELINIDGKGNRVAAMMFGPKKVIVLAGKNKIVNDENEAWDRLRGTTAPNLASHLGRKTPCVSTKSCTNCSSPERICRFYTIIHSQMPIDKDRIHIVLINEDLGI